MRVLPAPTRLNSSISGNGYTSNQPKASVMNSETSSNASDNYVSQTKNNSNISTENDDGLNWLQKTLIGIAATGTVVLGVLYAAGRHFEFKVCESIIKERNPDGIENAHAQIEQLEKDLIKKRKEAGDSASPGLKTYGQEGSFVKDGKLLIQMTDLSLGEGSKIKLHPVVVPWNETSVLVDEVGNIRNVVQDNQIYNHAAKSTVKPDGSSTYNGRNYGNPVVVGKDGRVLGDKGFIASPRIWHRITMGWSGLTSLGKGGQEGATQSIRNNIVPAKKKGKALA